MIAAEPSRKTLVVKRPKREYSSGRKNDSVRYLISFAGAL